jgi:hypothetical protein
MIKIYKLVPEPKLMGSFSNGILEINGKEFEMTRDEILNHFNRGYYRTGEI